MLRYNRNDFLWVKGEMEVNEEMKIYKLTQQNGWNNISFKGKDKFGLRTDQIGLSVKTC